MDKLELYTLINTMLWITVAMLFSYGVLPDVTSLGNGFKAFLFYWTVSTQLLLIGTIISTALGMLYRGE